MIVPLGLRIASGVVAGRRFFAAGSPVVPKWAVLPVSAMTEGEMMEVGGPMGEDEKDTKL